MALLDRLKKEKKTADAPKKAATKKAAPAEKAVEATPSMLRPHVSEKAARLAHNGVYVFNVPLTANKVEIAKAVEAQFKVNVTGVRIIRNIGKVVRRAAGRTGRRSNAKKALVQLKKGQTLNLTEGV